MIVGGGYGFAEVGVGRWVLVWGDGCWCGKAGVGGGCGCGEVGVVIGR